MKGKIFALLRLVGLALAFVLVSLLHGWVARQFEERRGR
jgi:hypothetical protein